jgi:uncharacterized protein with ATP-grasp and redox domains
LIWPDCIPCILRMSLEVARPTIKDESHLRRLMREVSKLKPLRGEDWEVTPPEVIRDVWLKVNEISGEADPLKALKAEQNRRALQIYPLAKELVLKNHDPFPEAVKLAVAGNSMDAMGDVRKEPAQEVMDRLSKFVIRPEALEGLRERLGKARRLVYLGDNCGEIVFDRLFIEFLRQTYDLEVTFVTRSLPVLNDATLQDALAVGIDNVAEVVESGIREPLCGIMLKKVSPEVRALIEGADLVISKGGGNHDTLTEEENLKGKVSFLLQVKCHPYCTIHQLPLGALVVLNS